MAMARCLLGVAALLAPHGARGLSLQTLPDNREDAHVVFLAGLEGAGHGYLQEVWKQSFPQKWENIVPLPPSWRCGEEWGTEGVAELQARLEGFGGGTDYNRGTGGGPVHLLWSFPQQETYPECGDGSHERRMKTAHPRLEYLLEAARGVRLNFHVIFLYRDLADNLAANCIAHKHEECRMEAETMRANAQELALQLKRMPPDSIWCFRTNDLTEDAIARAPDFSESTRVQLLTGLRGDTAPEKFGGGAEDWADYVATLSDANKELDNVCRSVEEADLQTFENLVRQGARVKHHIEMMNSNFSGAHENGTEVAVVGSLPDHQQL